MKIRNRNKNETLKRSIELKIKKCHNIRPEEKKGTWKMIPTLKKSIYWMNDEKLFKITTFVSGKNGKNMINEFGVKNFLVS